MTKKPKILVVDNELDICNFVKSFFELRGFEVVTALNGDEGLATAIKHSPDVVILDVVLRRENEGIEYLPKIKKDLPAARVIMVTAVDDTQSVEDAKRLGADDYITKPLILEYLESTVLSKIKNFGIIAA
jgi:DNA-binding response OmpR family regulator